MALDKKGNMVRPLMGPSFLEDEAPNPKARKPFRPLHFVGWVIGMFFLTIWRVLTYDPLKRKLRIEEGNFVSRTLRGLGYRLFFLPVAVAGLVCLIVWNATHQRVNALEKDPGSSQLYYDAVTFVTSDNVSIEGALFPMLDARQILLEQEKALRKRYPAVVLVHDFGMRKDQLLPLVRPLHEAGFVVLTMNLRGIGGSGSAAQTFGLREALDVKAGVEMLRRRPYVDAARVTVLGAGTGATAAMVAAKADPAIAAVVACDPVRDVETLLEGKLAPRHQYLTWMRPLCKWTFEFAYALDIDDVEWSEFDAVRLTRPTLVLGNEGGLTDFTRPRHVETICNFLVKQVAEPHVAGAGE